MREEAKQAWRGIIEDYARKRIARLPSGVNEYFKEAYKAEFGEPIKACSCNEAHRDAAIRLVARWREEAKTEVAKDEAKG